MAGGGGGGGGGGGNEVKKNLKRPSLVDNVTDREDPLSY